MWDLTSPFRQNLVKIGMPSAALYIGSGVHEVLEANARGEDWRVALDKWKTDEIQEFIVYYSDRVGMAPSSDELSLFDEAHETVTVLMERYFTRYSESAPLGENYEYVAVEQTCAVPIPGTNGTFTFTLDGLARDKRNDTLWVVEHKTYAQNPDMDRLSTDHQITAYAWGVAAILGEDIAGFLYDGISKKTPSEPALLKSGRLSEQFTQTIDGQSYRAAIQRHGLDVADYADILARLDERDQADQTPFYTRWRIPVLKAQVDAFAGYIVDIYTDMVSNPRIYPNFRFDGCLTAGTPILMANGSWTNIEDIQLGDRLFAIDGDGNGQPTETEVVMLWNRESPEILEMKFESGRILNVTPEHPIHVQGQWIDAAKCAVGMEVTSLGSVQASDNPAIRDLRHLPNTGGSAVNAEWSSTDRITEISWHKKTVEVYNLTCAPNANYIADGILVHNCWDCGMRDLCKSMQLGDDVEWVKKTYYMQGRGSQSFQRRGGTPTVVDKATLLAGIKA